jgi:hypothetical protein
MLDLFALAAPQERHEHRPHAKRFRVRRLRMRVIDDANERREIHARDELEQAVSCAREIVPPHRDGVARKPFGELEEDATHCALRLVSEIAIANLAREDNARELSRRAVCIEFFVWKLLLVCHHVHLEQSA